MQLELPKGFFAFVIGLAAFATLWASIGGEPLRDPWLLVLLGICLAIGDARGVYLPRGETASFGAVFGLSGVWLLPPAAAALMQVLAGILHAAYRRSWGLARWFNTAQAVLATLLAAWVFRLLAGPDTATLPPAPWPYLISGMAYAIVNLGYVGVALALYQKEPILGRVLALYQSHGWRYLVLLGLSLLLVQAFVYFGAAVWVVALVVIVALDWLHRDLRDRQFRHVVRQVLALVPQRPVERRHTQRLVRYAADFGRVLGLPEAFLRDLRYAALFHDAALDVMATPEPLTEQQWERVRQHPVRAADQIGRVLVLNRVAQIVRYHHERWDGGGYPSGLKGTDIPFGSRILAILEAFDTLTTGRGYKSPVGLQTALEELEREAGRQFDPNLTTAFINFVLENEEQIRTTIRAASRETWQRQLRPLTESLRELVSAQTIPGRAGTPAESAHGLPPGDLHPGLEVLWQLGYLLNQTLDAASIRERVLRIGGRLLVTPVWLTLSDPWEGGEVVGLLRPEAELVVWQAEPITPMRSAVAETRTVQMAVSVDGPWRSLLGSGDWMIVSVPLKARGRVIGTLSAARPLPAAFEAFEVSMLELIAGMAALALDNAQLYGMVRERLAQVSALKRFTDQLLDRLPLAVVAFGTDGDVRLINQRARVLFTALGLDPARLERLPLRAWVRLDRRWATVDRALRIGGEWEEPALELVLGGERRLFHVYVAPVISHDEKVVAAVGIAWDVTHIHRFEQQAREAERMAAIGQLAAGAAHEIRNPLTAIKGFVQLFQRRARAGEEGEAWNVVLVEIERIERLLRDLLLMAKPQQPERAPCDLNLLVERVLLLLEAQARECGVTIETALEPGLPVLVADGQQLRQVLYNLVLNAIEAMPDGGRLRVETALAGDGRQVVLQVRDTGVGIEPDHLDRVAEPFFTTKAHGTGLGLAVVRSIVNNHGGTIECESQPGRGTTFIVRLPLDGSTATAANRRPDERRPADSRRVLKE